MDCSPAGFSVHGIFQARILEWIVIPISRGSSPPRDRTSVSCIAGRFFTVWATREAPLGTYLATFYKSDVLKIAFPRRRERDKHFSGKAGLGPEMMVLPLQPPTLGRWVPASSVPVWLALIGWADAVFPEESFEHKRQQSRSFILWVLEDFTDTRIQFSVSLRNRRNGQIPEPTHVLVTTRLWVRGIWKWAKNGQLPDIPPQGRGKLRELYLHGFWEFLWRAKK